MPAGAVYFMKRAPEKGCWHWTGVLSKNVDACNGEHKPEDPSVMLIIHAWKTGLTLESVQYFHDGSQHNKTCYVLLRGSNLDWTNLSCRLDVLVTAAPAVHLMFRAVSPTNAPPATAPSLF